ncbi:hypothetical protein [Lishizhenia sp.]|uniref:Ppx/GppA phosphatase family protein n=1 Tax=Lishizhenia sp. TaxID=2497594 RepID=UPI00299DBB2D|nr:hypothetical protein [Lishizhenia sp.]MDX1446829.1 hypothetical protein [Lishizhenia sp.]
MTGAVIDLGTNTFNLLIFKKTATGRKILFKHKEGVALGMGGINQQTIVPDAFERGISTLEQFKAICDQHGVEQIRAIGTSALRAAENRDDFIQAAFAMTEIPITIIDGETEAELIYRGIQTAHVFEDKSIILDIGGGSSEFIFANNNEVIKSKSFEIGVSRIYQQFEFNDPLTNSDIDAIINYLEQSTRGFFDDIRTNILVGASGSFETFYEIIENIDFPTNSQSQQISKERLHWCIDNLIKSSLAERKLNDRIIPIRKIMAPIAAVKVMWLMDKLDINTIYVSPHSMKEGLMEHLF